MFKSQIVNVMESVEVIGVGDSSACNRLPELVCAGSTSRDLAFNGSSETYYILGRENGTGFRGIPFRVALRGHLRSPELRAEDFL